jgi:hypothetical protein
MSLFATPEYKPRKVHADELNPAFFTEMSNALSTLYENNMNCTSRKMNTLMPN